MKRIKVITSYTKSAQWWSEVDKDPIGEIPRAGLGIPSPYAYSPVFIVWNWQNRHVIYVETKHQRYEVFDIENTPIMPLESE